MVNRILWLFFGTFLAVIGVIPAIFGAMINELNFAGLFGLFLAAPLIEEIIKPAGVYGVLLLNKEFPFKRISIPMISLISGICFAFIENYIYLNIYFPEHSPALENFRYTYCVLLHATCSFIYGFSIVNNISVLVFKKKGKINFILPAISISLHGFYNLFVFIFWGDLK